MPEYYDKDKLAIIGLLASGYQCPGNGCRVRFDAGTVRKTCLDTAFKAIQFDHTYDQAFARQSMQIARTESAIDTDCSGT